MAFSYYKTATLDHTQAGSGNSTNWPLTVARGTVQSADTDLKTVANGGFVQNSNGYDIRPYSDSALTTPLTYELVYYDGVNGKFEMHVNIPTLSASVDTVIYLAFGDATISTNGSSNTTWDSNFRAVYHYGDGTTLSMADSTSNAFNLTQHTGGAAAGEIGGAYTMSGSGDYADVASFSLGATTLTVETWLYTTTFAQSVMIVCKEVVNADWELFMESGAGSEGVAGIKLRGASATGIGAAPPSTSNWHYIIGTITGTTGTIYIDSVSAATGTVAAVANTTDFLNIGRFNNAYYLNGVVDETRISKVIRNTDYITATYNSQKPSSTFITWGAKTAVSGTTIWNIAFV